MVGLVLLFDHCPNFHFGAHRAVRACVILLLLFSSESIRTWKHGMVETLKIQLFLFFLDFLA